MSATLDELRAAFAESTRRKAELQEELFKLGLSRMALAMQISLVCWGKDIPDDGFSLERWRAHALAGLRARGLPATMRDIPREGSDDA